MLDAKRLLRNNRGSTEFAAPIMARQLLLNAGQIRLAAAQQTDLCFRRSYGVGEVMGGAFSSAGLPLSCFFRSSSDALLMACCCFWARLGTFGSGVALAAGCGFEQEQIIPSVPAANRVIRIFLMSIFGCELGSKWSRRDIEMRRVFGLSFSSR